MRPGSRWSGPAVYDTWSPSRSWSNIVSCTTEAWKKMSFPPCDVWTIVRAELVAGRPGSRGVAGGGGVADDATCARSSLGGPRSGLAEHRMARRAPDHGPGRAGRRFPARSGRAHGRPDLGGNPPHRPAHLLGARRAIAGVPRSPRDLGQRPGEDELVMGRRHQVRPALELRGRPHAGGVPQQGLLVEFIPMFDA